MPNTAIEEKKEVTTPVKAETKKPEPKKTEKKETKEKKPRAPRARKIEELITEAAKNMTDKEKLLIIDYLKAEIALRNTKIENLKMNCESAYAKLRQAEADMETMENYYKRQLGFVDTQVKAFAQAVTKATVGGIN